MSQNPNLKPRRIPLDKAMTNEKFDIGGRRFFIVATSSPTLAGGIDLEFPEGGKIALRHGFRTKGFGFTKIFITSPAQAGHWMDILTLGDPNNPADDLIDFEFPPPSALYANGYGNVLNVQIAGGANVPVESHAQPSFAGSQILRCFAGIWSVVNETKTILSENSGDGRDLALKLWIDSHFSVSNAGFTVTIGDDSISGNALIIRSKETSGTEDNGINCESNSSFGVDTGDIRDIPEFRFHTTSGTGNVPILKFTTTANGDIHAWGYVRRVQSWETWS